MRNKSHDTGKNQNVRCRCSASHVHLSFQFLLHTYQNGSHHPAEEIVTTDRIIEFARKQRQPVEVLMFENGPHVIGSDKFALSYFIRIYLSPSVNLDLIAISEISQMDKWTGVIVSIPDVASDYSVSPQVGKAEPAR